MAFTYDPVADRVKDDVGSFQFVNRLLNNFSYLKQQSEVTVAAGATTMKDDVVRPAHFAADNEPERGTIYLSDSATPATGSHVMPELSEFLRFTLED